MKSASIVGAAQLAVRAMNLLDILFPKKCINCKKFGDFLCADCFAKIKYNESFEPVSGELDGVISAVIYNSIIRKLIRQFKYKPYVSKLAEIISEIMNEGLAQNEAFYNFIEQFESVIIPIPLSPRRLRERGYNHAEILASFVAKYFDLKIEPKILVRIKETKPQFRLNKEERKKNVEDAFSVRKDPKTPLLGQRPTGPAANIPKAVVIIDDLATSLATLKEAAKVLKSAGAKKVLGVTFAREV